MSAAIVSAPSRSITVSSQQAHSPSALGTHSHASVGEFRRNRSGDAERRSNRQSQDYSGQSDCTHYGALGIGCGGLAGAQPLGQDIHDVGWRNRVWSNRGGGYRQREGYRQQKGKPNAKPDKDGRVHETR